MAWKTFVPPYAVREGHSFIFGLFFREMPKSFQVRLEPEPKGVAHIPLKVIDSWGPMPSRLPAHYWFMVSDSWLEKAKVKALSRRNFHLLQTEVDRKLHPLLSEGTEPEDGTKKPKQGDLFVKREGEW